MTVVKALVTLMDLLLLVLVVGPIMTSAACSAQRDGVDIEGVVMVNVATCTGNQCNGDNGNVIIYGCETVVCNDAVFGCRHARITNTNQVICTGENRCAQIRISHVRNVTCQGEYACAGAVIETVPNGVVLCVGGSAYTPACVGDGEHSFNSISVQAGCLFCGKGGCGGNYFTFTDWFTKESVRIPDDGTVGTYGPSCRREKFQGITVAS